MVKSDRESIIAVEKKRSQLQSGQKLMLIMQDEYPQWNFYTVAFTPENEKAAVHILSARSAHLCATLPSWQKVIIFNHPNDNPPEWRQIKNMVATTINLPKGGGKTQWDS